MLLAVNSFYVYATAAKAPIIIAPDFVQTNFGDAADLSSAQAKHLTAVIEYEGDFGPSIIQTDGEASHPGATPAQERPTFTCSVSTKTGSSQPTHK